MWGILNTLSNSEVEEVTIDSAANWKAAKILGTGIKVGILVLSVLISKLWSSSRIPLGTTFRPFYKPLQSLKSDVFMNIR